MANRTAQLFRRGLPVLLLAWAASACSSRQDVLVSKLRGRGTARTYAVAPEQAWTISKTLLKLEGTDEIEEHRSDGYLLTAQRAEGLSAGTYLGIFVEGEPPSATRVTVVTRRRSPVQAYPGLSESGFHTKFAELLAMAAAVAPAPSCAPANDHASAGGSGSAAPIATTGPSAQVGAAPGGSAAPGAAAVSAPPSSSQANATSPASPSSSLPGASPSPAAAPAAPASASPPTAPPRAAPSGAAPSLP